MGLITRRPRFPSSSREVPAELGPPLLPVGHELRPGLLRDRLIATSTSKHDFMPPRRDPVAHGPRQAGLLVVAGTLTDKMAPALGMYDQDADGRST